MEPRVMDHDGSYGLVHFNMVPLLVQIYRSWMVSLGRKICSAGILIVPEWASNHGIYGSPAGIYRCSGCSFPSNMGLTLSMVSIQESDFSMQWATLNLKKKMFLYLRGRTLYIYTYINVNIHHMIMSNTNHLMVRTVKNHETSALTCLSLD